MSFLHGYGMCLDQMRMDVFGYLHIYYFFRFLLLNVNQQTAQNCVLLEIVAESI